MTPFIAHRYWDREKGAVLVLSLMPGDPVVAVCVQEDGQVVEIDAVDLQVEFHAPDWPTSTHTFARPRTSV